MTDATVTADARRAAPPAPPVHGDGAAPRIPGFALLRRLGQGACGDVWLAEPADPTLPRRVALKVLRRRALARESELRRLVREGRLGRSLRHPNILRVHDVVEWRDTLVLVQEFVDGSTLRDWQPRDEHGQPLSGRALIAARLAALAQVARALDAAHAQGVVHRDVKPSNMLVDRDGRAVLIDFGLAREADVDATLTASDAVMGSPAYMAPELVSGGARDADARADVWSLGICLYELATGRPPFAAPGWDELWLAILRDEPPRLARRAPVALPGLEPLVLRALEKDPARRFPTAGALAGALDDWLVHGRAAASGRGLLLRRWRRQLGRRRGLLLGLAVVLLALLAWGLERDRRAGRAELGLVTALARGERELLNGDLGAALAACDEAAEALPGDARPALRRAEALAAFELLGAAAEAVDRAQALGWDPRGEAPRDLLARGLRTAARGEPSAGVALLERARAAAPDLEAVYVPLHGLLLGLGRDERAAAVIEAWSQHVKPRDPRWQLVRALRLEASGDPAGALALLEQLGDPGPLSAGATPGDDPTPRFWVQRHLGRLHLLSGDLERAEACLLAALEAVPRDAPSWHNLGLVAHARGDRSQARACAVRALDHEPGLVRSVELLVRSALDDGGPGAALAALEAHRPGAPRLDGLAADLHLEAGARADTAGDVSAARAHWRAAQQLRHGDLEAAHALGMQAWLDGAADEAVAQFARARSLWLAPPDDGLLATRRSRAAFGAREDLLAVLVGLFANHCALGDEAAARRTLAELDERLAGQGSPPPETALNLAEVLATGPLPSLRDAPRARALLEQAGLADAARVPAALRPLVERILAAQPS